MRIALVAVLLASATSARAECAHRHWIGHADGAPIPAHGTLYYDDEVLDEPPGIRVDGTVTFTPESDHVTRIDYRARVGSEMRVDHEWEPSTFPVIAEVPVATPRIVMYWHLDSSWTCSNADSLMVQLDQPVAAVRAAWTRGEVTETHLVVPQMRDGKVIVELGKLDCGGANIDPDELRLGGHLALVAIRIDGSEVALTGLPDPLSTDDLVTDEDGTSFGVTVLPPIEPAPEVAPPPPANTDSSGPIAGAIVLAIAALAVAWGLRSGMRAV